MLHFFISKDLEKSLYPHIELEITPAIQELRWYAHSLETYEGRFLITMEEATRYCIVFHQLNDKDFCRFPLLFRDRLWREVLTLCKEKVIDRTLLVAVMKDFLSQIHFTLGWDFTECSEIFSIAEDLTHVLDRQGLSPTFKYSELTLGLQLNQIKRHSNVLEGAVFPLNAFRSFWYKKIHARGAIINNRQHSRRIDA